MSSQFFSSTPAKEGEGSSFLSSPLFFGTPQQDQPQKQGESPLSSGQDIRNVTRRSARRQGEEEESPSQRMSLGGEGRLLQLESENAALSSEVERLRERLSLAGRPSVGAESLSTRRLAKQQRWGRRHLLRDSILHTVSESSEGTSVSRGDKLSRTASLATAAVLQKLPRSQSTSSSTSTNSVLAAYHRSLAERMIQVFKEPLKAEHTAYLCSRRFADDLVSLSEAASRRFEREARVLRLESPAYVFGDVHGNLEDLHFFSDHIWKLGVPLLAGHLLFLGDYVDRGLQSLEVVAYLFALKVHQPRKVWMLRGNHETRDVNGWKEHYGDRSFLWQCEIRFGPDVGGRVWEAVNHAFDALPLAALVDDEIFCVHGGLPRRPRPAAEDGDERASANPPTRIEMLDRVPHRITINPPDPSVDPDLQRMAAECVWSDPAQEDQEHALDETGFGESLRGGGTICFGNKAIETFFRETGCSFIMRAHEAHAYGVSLSKGATVFTIFSTSKDHHQGSMAKAGCVLVDLEAIQVINRSPHYKNRYIHKRDSFSLAGLAPDELDRRAALGLVLPHSNSGNEDDFARQFDSYDDDDEYYYYDDHQIIEDDEEETDDDDDDFFPRHDRDASKAPSARLVDPNYKFMPEDDDDDT